MGKDIIILQENEYGIGIGAGTVITTVADDLISKGQAIEDIVEKQPAPKKPELKADKPKSKAGRKKKAATL